MVLASLDDIYIPHQLSGGYTTQSNKHTHTTQMGQKDDYHKWWQWFEESLHFKCSTCSLLMLTSSSCWSNTKCNQLARSFNTAAWAVMMTTVGEIYGLYVKHLSNINTISYIVSYPWDTAETIL
jgi:sulfatase maturation enzyme AslB (radical SAM superfamily)